MSTRPPARSDFRPLRFGHAARRAVPLLALLAAACGTARHADDVDLSPVPAGPTAPPPGVTLAGEWQFDAQHSDQPGSRGGRGGTMGGGRGMGGGMGGRGGMGGGMGGMGGRGGRGGGQPGGASPAGGQGGPGAAARAPRRMVIVQTDSTVSFETSDGRTIMLRTDGSPVVTQGPEQGTAMQVSGRWTHGYFEVRRIIADRVTFVERYALNKDGSQLIVRVRVSTGPDDTNPPESRRVYDRQAAR